MRGDSGRAYTPEVLHPKSMFHKPLILLVSCQPPRAYMACSDVAEVSGRQLSVCTDSHTPVRTTEQQKIACVSQPNKPINPENTVRIGIFGVFRNGAKRRVKQSGIRCVVSTDSDLGVLSLASPPLFHMTSHLPPNTNLVAWMNTVSHFFKRQFSAGLDTVISAYKSTATVQLCIFVLLYSFPAPRTD